MVENKRTIYLVRHCEPDRTLGIRYDVPPGPPLSALGRKQAEELREFFDEIGVKEIYCSPFARTQETAKLGILSDGRRLVTVEALSEIRDDEPWEHVKSRVENWVKEVKNSLFNNTCIVGHGASIEALLIAFGVDLHRARRFRYGNILPQGCAWKVVLFNDAGLASGCPVHYPKNSNE